MSAKRGWIIGCATVGLMGVVAIVGIGLFIHHVSQAPVGMRLSLAVPDTVAVDDEATLTVVVFNDDDKRVLRVGDVDISANYLNGFVVLGTDPAPKSSMEVPLIDSRSFTFGVDVPPGDSKRFIFRLRPTTPGVFRGDVDVWEGARFLTMVAETRVQPK